MIIYFFFFIILFLLSFSEVFFKKKDFSWLFFTLLLLCVLVSVRYNVGTDWARYVEHYKEIKPIWDLHFSDYIIEPLFVTIISLCKSVGLDYQICFFIFAIISIFVLFISFHKIGPYIAVPFLIYYGFHFLSYQMNIVRHGIMTSFIVLSWYYIYKRRIYSYILCISIGAMFQSLALMFMPFYFLLKYKYSIKQTFLFLLFSFLFYQFVDLNIVLLALPIFQSKMEYYTVGFYSEIDGSSYGFSIGFIFSLFLFFLLRLFLMKNRYDASINRERILLNCLMWSIFMGVIFNNLSLLVERIVGVLNMSITILLSLLVFSSRGKRQVIIFCFIVLYSLLSLMMNLKPKGIYNDNQFVPYQYKII